MKATAEISITLKCSECDTELLATAEIDRHGVLELEVERCETCDDKVRTEMHEQLKELETRIQELRNDNKELQQENEGLQQEIDGQRR